MAPDVASDATIEAFAVLAEPVRRRLYDLVTAADGPIGRDEAAAALGIGRPLAAFHLDRLVQAGLLTTEFRRLTGRSGPGAGRPAKLYRRAARTIHASLPPRQYELAARFFAEGLDEVGPAASAAAMEAARAFGRRAGAEAWGAADAAPDAATDGLPALLGELGFEPRVDEASGEIVLRSCPFDALAATHRELTCGMNRALLEGLRDGLGSPRTVLARPAPGRCCVVFGPPPDALD
ncbi:MAG TPA: helix-turn-helix domain-containing protein [Candidatus Limnocylindrales bacterium]